jgi:dipeptidyl aminopeptidase/acylaminoacyl peptidase
LLLGGPAGENPEKAEQAGPIRYVSSDDPPFLIMHGDSDHVVPLFHSQMLHETLRKANVPSRLEVLPESGHGIGGFTIPYELAMTQAMETVRQFFDAHLRPAAASQPTSAPLK